MSNITVKNAIDLSTLDLDDSDSTYFGSTELSDSYAWEELYYLKEGKYVAKITHVFLEPRSFWIELDAEDAGYLYEKIDECNHDTPDFIEES